MRNIADIRHESTKKNCKMMAIWKKSCTFAADFNEYGNEKDINNACAHAADAGFCPVARGCQRWCRPEPLRFLIILLFNHNVMFVFVLLLSLTTRFRRVRHSEVSPDNGRGVMTYLSLKA